MSVKKKVATGAGVLAALAASVALYVAKPAPAPKSLGTPIGIVEDEGGGINHSPATGYTVTSHPSGGVDQDAGSLSLSHRVTGLRNGTAYTFTVIARNEYGDSPPSLPSLPVTPDVKYCPGIFCDGFESGGTVRWAPNQ